MDPVMPFSPSPIKKPAGTNADGENLLVHRSSFGFAGR